MPLFRITLIETGDDGALVEYEDIIADNNLDVKAYTEYATSNGQGDNHRRYPASIIKTKGKRKILVEDFYKNLPEKIQDIFINNLDVIIGDDVEEDRGML